LFSSTTLLFIRTLAALGAVCLAAWVLLRWGLPRWLPHLSAGDPDDGPIDILARRAVGPKRAILLVRVADQTLVVGETESGLTRLGELPQKPPSRGGSTPTPRRQSSGALPIVELGESGLGDSAGRSPLRARTGCRAGQARQSPSPVSVVEPVDPSEIQTTQETAAPEPAGMKRGQT